jgi:hypothetical protein
MLMAAVRLHGVTRQSATKWSGAVEAAGVVAVKSQKFGPKVHLGVEAHEERPICRAIREDVPHQMRLPSTLWSRGVVVALIE